MLCNCPRAICRSTAKDRSHDEYSNHSSFGVIVVGNVFLLMHQAERNMEDLFRRLDMDGSGTLDKAEVRQVAVLLAVQCRRPANLTGQLNNLLP